MLVPKSLYYTENHLWLRKIGLYDFCIGITDFAQKEIGEIHLVEFSKQINEQVNILTKGDSYGAIYGINKTFELIAPCDCKIMEINPNIMIKPSHINTDPYNCWLVILSIDITADKLLTYEDYIQITNDF
ncbi:glycine cleavage system protein H [Chryseobacterium sp. Ch-15]|uniref:Glycine cleavage system protein H n=1 Tax=Chryseobacterium muglaense TaxID=2893752 RepID=A0A9Q3UYC3_9FLAO|nr:glycine cleavage system protein H [Chryseobacterium muglaense]MBD3906446.1 glycine cleavage system protein H [Chryseobacterium muglaense]MCC9036842.1 glycine cleavage system protein H [Chryseobacterium muglaense]MCM2556168.1 glycine cleavage system protein H [Chryseobacterium muglaense]